MGHVGKRVSPCSGGADPESRLGITKEGLSESCLHPGLEVGIMFSLGTSVVTSSPQLSKAGSLCADFIILGECTHIFQKAQRMNFREDAKFPPSPCGTLTLFFFP